ncbi:MAG: 7-cyano-7-deazaguanine synthase QueC [Gemmatimonadaceae bacterium]|nr:7-cyano-7-deazaguanine synthase QueC [Gemmatimonadaceae bacterium]
MSSLNTSSSGHDSGALVRPAVVLLSGGLDSATALAVARRDGYTPCAMTFRYGQRHMVEIDAARRVAAAQGVSRHVVVDIDLRQWGGSALTADMEVPKDRDVDHADDSVPITYVPARNTIFLSFALAWAEVLGADAIFIGVNALDYSGYPDCRPEYVAAFEAMANLATAAGVQGTQRLRIHAPLQHLTKAQIVALGCELGVDYSLTTSCYDPAPDGTACGHCDACQLRLRGFAEAGSADPIAYASN